MFFTRERLDILEGFHLQLPDFGLAHVCDCDWKQLLLLQGYHHEVSNASADVAAGKFKFQNDTPGQERQKKG